MNAPAQRTFNVNRTLPRSCSAAPRRLSVKLRDGHLLDGRVDLAARRLLGDAVVVVAVARSAEALDELLVVRDDDELEVLLLLAVLDHLVQRGGEGLGVGRVEVGRRLVERQDAAVDAKRLGEGEPDDEAGEHLLPRGAAAAHVEQVVTLAHHHAVRVLARARVGVPLVLGLDLDPVDVGALVGLVPQLLGRAVDLLHLCLVEADQRAVERLVVAVEVADDERDRLHLDQLLGVPVVDVPVAVLVELRARLLEPRPNRLDRAGAALNLELLLVDGGLDLVDLGLDGPAARQVADALSHRVKLLLLLRLPVGRLAVLEVGEDLGLQLLLGGLLVARLLELLRLGLCARLLLVESLGRLGKRLARAVIRLLQPLPALLAQPRGELAQPRRVTLAAGDSLVGGGNLAALRGARPVQIGRERALLLAHRRLVAPDLVRLALEARLLGGELLQLLLRRLLLGHLRLELRKLDLLGRLSAQRIVALGDAPGVVLLERLEPLLRLVERVARLVELGLDLLLGPRHAVCRRDRRRGGRGDVLVQLGLLVVQLLELRHVDAQIEHLLLRLLEAIPLGAQLVQPRLLRPQRLPVRARLVCQRGDLGAPERADLLGVLGGALRALHLPLRLAQLPALHLCPRAGRVPSTLEEGLDAPQRRIVAGLRADAALFGALREGEALLDRVAHRRALGRLRLDVLQALLCILDQLLKVEALAAEARVRVGQRLLQRLALVPLLAQQPRRNLRLRRQPVEVALRGGDLVLLGGALVLAPPPLHRVFLAEVVARELRQHVTHIEQPLQLCPPGVDSGV
mmetsp:Transcript_31054/g.101477  ORF Transcript_31054/g.101477 Transcript_31054/m.101477 type:complete len:799 (+) Transcript_31054:193-2589(+)